MLDSNRLFRLQLVSIGQVVLSFGVQLVFLTAMLPLEDKERFYSMIGLKGQHVQMFREQIS